MGKNSLKSKYDKMAASIEAANIYDGEVHLTCTNVTGVAFL